VFLIIYAGLITQPVVLPCRYARSIVSRVDHARELQQSLAPEERADWTCVWEAGRGCSWESYTATALAGTAGSSLRHRGCDSQQPRWCYQGVQITL